MPKYHKVPSSTTYLPAPALSSLQPPNPPSFPAPVPASTLPPALPVIYPPVPPGSTPQPAQPGAEFTADPIRLKTWGPYTYIHDPRKKEKLRVNKDGYAVRKKPKVPHDLEAVLSDQADTSLEGKLRITLECKEESYGTQLVEKMPDGAVKRTWVTSLVVTTWETEREAGAGEMEDGEESGESEGSGEDGSSDESSSDDSEDGGKGKRRSKKDGKKSGKM
ncbi:hypothetical protein MMC34_005943 [Xylographa carneopallida]|nr:hypothetical protein [Xylographa carneopallida]